MISKARKVGTGVKELDRMLRGGFPTGLITLIYGEATAGKTTLALMALLAHLKKTQSANAYLIDSDNKINVARLSQLTEYFGKSVLRRLHMYIPKSFAEQGKTIESLPQLYPEDLIIIDSVTGIYRGETGDEAQTYRINKELNRQLGYLAEIAMSTGASIIITGQVRSIFDTNQVEPVAPRLLSYWSSMIVKLEKTPRVGLRQVTIEKPHLTENTINIVIVDKGIQGVKH